MNALRKLRSDRDARNSQDVSIVTPAVVLSAEMRIRLQDFRIHVVTPGTRNIALVLHMRAKNASDARERAERTHPDMWVIAEG